MISISLSSGFRFPNHASRLHELLRGANLDQAAAAQALEIDELAMRGCYSGKRLIPQCVLLALERLAELNSP